MRYALFLGLTLAAAGCGDESLDAAAARRVWAALEHAEVANVLPLHTFYTTRAFAPTLTCEEGDASASVHHTEAWSQQDGDSPDGQVTGHVQYILHGCQSVHHDALHGTVWRTFHAVQRSEEEAMVQSCTDMFFGSLKLADGGRANCPVQLTRHIQDDETYFEGTVCGFAAADVFEEP